MRKLLYVLMASALVMLLAACGGAGPQPATAAKTTVLIYIEGTNLESKYNEATGNIMEMLAASPAPHLNVILTTGAADKEVSGDPVASWKTVKRHQIKDGRIAELADLGAINMGTTQVLTDFIQWGQTSFPADKYVLIFWDHGGGTNGGYGGDGPTNTSNLSVPELQRAIGNAVAVTGKRFEVIGFDACLMATAEIAYYLEPYAKYMVASEELEPGAGWNYTPFLNAIARNAAADGLAIGRAIADGFAAKAGKETDSYTLSVVDLSQIGGLMTAIVQLSEAIGTGVEKAGRTAWNLVASIRNQADEYGEDYIRRRFYNLIDIGHFAQLLGDVPDTSWHPSAAALQNIIKQAVRYSVAGAAHEASTGLSLFFPFHDFEQAQQQMLTYAQTPFNLQYYQAMSWFVLYPLNNRPGTGFTVATPVLNGSVVQAVATSPFALAEQYVAILASGASDSEYTLLGMDLADSSETGTDTYTLRYTRDNRWFALGGYQVTVIFESKLKDGRYVMSIPVYYRVGGSSSGADSRPINLAMLYDPATNTGVIRSAWEGIQAEGTAYREWVDLKPGDYITPVFQKVDTTAVPETITYEQGSEFQLTTTTLTFSRNPIPAGSYRLAFQVRDLAGNAESSPSIAYGVSTVAAKAAAPVQRPPVFLRHGFWSGLK